MDFKSNICQAWKRKVAHPVVADITFHTLMALGSTTSRSAMSSAGHHCHHFSVEPTQKTVVDLLLKSSICREKSCREASVQHLLWPLSRQSSPKGCRAWREDVNRKLNKHNKWMKFISASDKVLLCPRVLDCTEDTEPALPYLALFCRQPLLFLWMWSLSGPARSFLCQLQVSRRFPLQSAAEAPLLQMSISHSPRP